MERPPDDDDGGTPVTVCPSCGTTLARDSMRGLCPRCLIQRVQMLAPVDAQAPFAVPGIEELNALFTDFEVRELLGHGGMGAVYEAWQKSLARPVALKILPPDLTGSEDFLERFLREARSMAQLDHPNAARVFETGISVGGEPFIVMELIRGEPITSYAAANRLGLRERIELFRGVCAGVQHAHQKGIIHRDLKPSNILVGERDGRPTPVVIDFGLARPVGGAGHDETAWRSHGYTVGTPAYLSPEQAAGEEVDTRADIYSLGAVLYELLTGMPPVDHAALEGASRTTLPKRLRDTPVIRPSRVRTPLPGTSDSTAGGVAGPDTTPGMEGDLDAIILKALAKEPAGRYATVGGLADDLARHLRGEPVSAVTPTPAYVLRKFLRRHAVGVGASVALVALLVAGVALLVRYSVLTRRAERLAEARMEQGERLIEFMLGDLHAKLTEVGRIDVLEGVITETERFYSGAATSASPESLRNRGRARLALGRIRNAQGHREVARGHLEEAIRLLDAAAKAQPRNLAGREELVQAWNSLAVVEHLAQAVPQAEKAYLAALEVNSAMRVDDPGNFGWKDTRASTLHNLAALYDLAGRLDDAERTYGEALALWEPMLAMNPDHPELLDHVAEFHQSLAFVHGKRKRTAEAEKATFAALHMRERLVELDPKNMNRLSQLAGTQQNVSELYLRQDRLDLAEEWVNRYRPIREQLAQRDPSNAVWSVMLADADRNFALVRVRRGDDVAAAAAHRRAWETSEAVLKRADPDPVTRERWLEGLKAAVPVYERLAKAAEASGATDEAAHHRETLAGIRTKLADTRP